MKALFRYNWQVRDEWFQLWEEVPAAELSRERNAGAGSILKTFLHIIDAEYSWMRAILSEPDIVFRMEDFNDLRSIKELSDKLRPEVEAAIACWTDAMEYETIRPVWMNRTYSKGEILRHILVHEIHHIGQLSVWARELNIQPASADFIGRQFMERSC